MKKPKNMDSGMFRNWWLEKHDAQASKLRGSGDSTLARPQGR